MEQTKTILKKTWVVAALACVCCLLWGSAIPLIKTGYRLMQLDPADTASQIVFAGVRFALAGILVLIFASLRERKVLLPDRTVLKYTSYSALPFIRLDLHRLTDDLFHRIDRVDHQR